MGLALVMLASNGMAKSDVATAALMVQLIRTAMAIADYHRATRNARQAADLDAHLGRLAGLPVVKAGQGATPTPGSALTPSGGPGLQLPTPLQAQPHAGARIHTERSGQDVGR